VALKRAALLLVAVALAVYWLFFFFESMGSPRTEYLDGLEMRIRGVTPTTSTVYATRTHYLTFDTFDLTDF
jgi:hypothetical protein